MDPLYQVLSSQPPIDLKANGEVSRMRSHKESKVKCNLQYPCSKCSSRGRECVFINDPEASRNKKLASSKRKLSLSASSSAGSVASSSPSSLFSESVAGSPTDFASAFSPFTPTTSTSPDPLMSMVPALSVSPGSSSTSSSQSSPRSDFFENQPDLSGTFDMTFDAYSLDSYLKSSFTGEPYFDSTLASCSPTQPAPITDFSWLDGNDFYPNFGDPTFGDDQFAFPQSHGLDDQIFTADFSSLTSAENIVDPSPRTASHQTLTMDALVNSFYDPAPVAIIPPQTLGSTSADLDLYLNLFFSAFCKQVPLVHIATWSMDDKPLILVRAMQACGALFVRTTTAAAFIDETLSSTRDALIIEFAKISSDPREQNNLLLTVVLLQTIGLFHQKADQRISSNVYHGMLVMMIRRTGVIPRVNAWLPSDISDAQSVDTAWREWANYEMIKRFRVLFLSYLHDCCHCMYFSLSPSFQPAELDICLPCDDALWSASDAREWYRAVQAPSPYGVGNPRILGFPMQAALTVLSETRLSTVTLALNPFAHFILIHTILRNLYASHADASPDSTNQLIGVDPEVSAAEERDNAFAIQYALHNWLQMWLGSPESMSVEESREEPPFIRNALPFYWLAQMSLLAIQDGSAVFGGMSSDAKAEGRFRLMKEWLDHIRASLRSGNQVPTHLWDELMKIRSQVSIEDAQAGDDHPNGLLAFFPSS
ncbi:hypothetical protein DXG01_009808 [Tephrocybe rancida]|nr:hypothetical protein DXG01_009808 [Tephrocybe rancida]